MRIHVVCGAGASSTFVALRLRRSIAGRGLDASVSSGSESDLATSLPVTDVLLVGPHLAKRFEAISGEAGLVGVRARLLPASVFTARDGEEALNLALALDLALENDPLHEKKGSTMLERTVQIGSTHGLHARPAKLFSQAAAAAGTPVTITKTGGKTVNAASILSVISLGINHGDEVMLAAEGEHAVTILDELTELLLTDHDA